MNAGEMRQDLISGRWVIYAPSRRKRPRDFQKAHPHPRHLPLHDDLCPFCPGNEQVLSRIILELKGNSLDWQLRIIQNKYPALTPEGDLRRTREGLFISMEGYGHHEVVIETPKHNLQIAEMSLDEVERIIESYHMRYHDLMLKEQNMSIIIFRNKGRRSGASIPHPHSQIISTCLVPTYKREQEYRAQQYFDTWGRCVYCDILQHELQSSARIVDQNQSFLTFVPYASEVPFEMSIMPKAHKASFAEISDQEKTDLAQSLRGALQRLHEKLNAPDYNYILHSPSRYCSGEPHVHWFLQISPRITTRAGFEMGSGISINTNLPEDDAGFLCGEDTSLEERRDHVGARHPDRG